MIISLGGACDIAIHLQKFGIKRETLFFDFTWNKIYGLKTVCNILLDDFSKFYDNENYIKREDHPIFGNCNINKYFPEFVFLHHDTNKPEIVESIKRKADRTKLLIESNEYKKFLYFRPYVGNDIKKDGRVLTGEENLKILIEETENFVEVFRKKYNDNFHIYSMLDFDYEYNLEKINNIMKKCENTKFITYTYKFKRYDKDSVKIQNSINRWKNILITLDNGR
jgi:hypothetical protein